MALSFGSPLFASLYPLESAVSTFQPPLLSRTVPGTGNKQCSYPRATRHTAGFMQKSLRMSPWGATTRLINRDRDAPSTPYHPPSSRIIAWPLIGKLDGFSTCEIGGLLWNYAQPSLRTPDCPIFCLCSTRFRRDIGSGNDISEGRIGRSDGRDIGAIYGTVSASSSSRGGGSQAVTRDLCDFRTNRGNFTISSSSLLFPFSPTY